ncbi:MAG: MFS transporter [Chloroflexi bacterium]|nr:MFS transporter [Chloroflexota bacterium]
MVLNALIGALVMHAYGAYVAVFKEEFGWSSTMLALGYSTIQGTNGVVGPGQGYLTDRFGPRAIIRVGLVVLAVGLVLFSQISQLGHLFPALFVVAVGMSLGGFLSVMVAIVHWFERYRATAISFITGGFALGGVLTFLVVLSIDTFGWERTALGSAVVVLAFGLPASQLVRTRPEDYGYRPDGAPAPERPASPAGGVAEIPHDAGGFTVSEALRTRQFWFISLGHGSALLVVSAVMVHLITHLTESLGYSLTQAGAIQSIIPISMVVGTLGGGILGDRVNKRALGAGAMVTAGIAILILVAANAFWMIVVFALLHGLAWGVRGPVLLAIRADYFGPRDFGKIMGLSQLVMTSGMMTGPLIAGRIRDITGGFETGFTILAVVALAGALLIVFSPPPRRPLAAAS